MGIFDFLGNKKAPAQANPSAPVLNVDPTQSTTSDFNPTDYSLPTVKQGNTFNEVQYPIPKGMDASTVKAQDLSSPVLPPVQSTQPVPLTESPVEQTVKPLEQTLPSLAGAPVVPGDKFGPNAKITELDGGIREITHSSQDQMPASQPQPAENLDIMSSPSYSAQSEITPPTDLAGLPPLPEPVKQEPIPVIPPLEGTPMTQEQPVEVLPELPVLTPVTPEPVTMPTPMPAEPAVDESLKTMNDTFEILPVTTEPTIPVTPEPELAPIAPEISVEPVAPVVQPAPVVETMTEIPEVEIPSIVPNPDPTPAVEAIAPAVSSVPDLPKEEVVNDAEVVKEDALKVLDKVAFVSLNVPSINPTLSKKVKTLTEMLGGMNAKFYVDSNKGYGMDVITGASKFNSKVTGVYLKPFYSNYSDEAEIDTQLNDYTSVIFSNIIERVKFLLREANVFIIPETSGLNNISLALLFSSLQFFYLGQHKPVIFLGLAWKNKMNDLKKAFSLSEDEMSSMFFASTPEEAKTQIRKLDEESSSKPPLKMKKVVDLRDGDDEREYLIAG